MRLLSRMIGGEALRGIRVERAWRRKPPLGNRDHAFPRHTTPLAATAENMPPHAIRTIPVPDWVKAGIDAWMAASGVTGGTLLRSINKAGRVWGCGFSPKVIWGVVKEKAKVCEIPGLAPHDLRRTCARLCHQAGGELEQIQFLLGHVSVQTAERYLGCKQRFHNAVNDRIGIEPDPPG